MEIGPVVSPVLRSSRHSELSVHKCHTPQNFLILVTSDTVVIAFKNIVGSREKCSYNRYVLITDTFLLRMDRNGSQAMVLIADMFL